MTLTLVHDLMILLSAGLLAGLACRRLNVSILIGYLLVGTLIGHGVLGWVNDDEHQLAHFAETGVFLLLFSIGLEFSIEDLRRLGINFAIGGGTQMLLVAVPVAAILFAFGMTWQAAVLIASALAFSSTVLVFRAFSEFGLAQRPHGRRAIGILLFQDAALVPLLLIVPLLTGDDVYAGPGKYFQLAFVSLTFVAAVIVLRHVLAVWIIPIFANYRSSELVVLFTLVSLGGVTLAAYSVGLPAAVGAFAAGLIFNGNRWSHQIDALVLPFRESFAAIFFVGLGLIFDPLVLWQEPILLLALPLLILLKAAAGTIALRLTGLSTRFSLGTGIGLAHVGEFAFVLALLGVDAGVLEEKDYQGVVAIAVGSLMLTPTLMKLGLRRLQVNDEEDAPSELARPFESGKRNAVVVGAGPIGRSIGSQLETLGLDVCVVDLSPINLHSFAQQGFRTVTGDATEQHVLEVAGGADAELVVVCVPDDATALRVVQTLRRLNQIGRVIVRCRYQSNAKKLEAAGASDIVAEESQATLALLRLL